MCRKGLITNAAFVRCLVGLVRAEAAVCGEKVFVRSRKVKMPKFNIESISNGLASGWAFSEKGKPLEVEVRCQNKCIARAAPAISRPDVAKAFSAVPRISECGFLVNFSAGLESFSETILDVSVWCAPICIAR